VRRESAGVSTRRWSGEDLDGESAGVIRLVDTDPVGWPRIYDLLLTVDGREQQLDRVELAAPPRTRPELTTSPNPFNPRLDIAFRLTYGGPVRLQVLDVRGRHVKTLVDEPCPAGSATVVWDGTDAAGRTVASGVYQVRLESEGGRVEERVTLVR
jgi:hypothetical protein